MAKLAAEFSAGVPKADVLLLADAASMEALKKDGRLLPYREAVVDGLDPGTYDADRTYFGSKLITTGIAVNTAAKSRPASWADLAKPEYKGQIAAGPLIPVRGDHAGTMTGRPDLGGRTSKEAPLAVAVRGNGAVVTAVARRREGVGVLVDFMAFNASQGSPIDFIFPAEGLPAVADRWPLSRPPERRAARAFVDFILSDEGRKVAVAMGYIPPKPASEYRRGRGRSRSA
jgi:iron(III) transport system substrate-binding protein